MNGDTYMRKITRLISVLLSLAILANFLPIIANAESDIYNDGVWSYRIDGDHAVLVGVTEVQKGEVCGPPSTLGGYPLKVISGVNCGALAGIRTTQFIIPQGVEVITQQAFNTGLFTSVVMPLSLKQVDFNAFPNCNSFNTIYYEGTAEDWEKISISYPGLSNEWSTNATKHYNYTYAASDNEESNYIQIGDYITLGTYQDEPIVWRCVDIDENGPLMLSDKILCLKAYDANGESEYYHSDGWGYVRKNSGSNCWSDSSIRQWLNSQDSIVQYSHCAPSTERVTSGYNAYDKEAGFLNSFTDKELSMIKTVTQKVCINSWETQRDGYCDGGTQELNYYPSKTEVDYSTYFYQNVTDKVFLLNPSQVDAVGRNLNGYLEDAYPTVSAVENSNYKNENLSADSVWSYFLAIPRNEGASYENVSIMTSTGISNAGASWGWFGIRPAFYLAGDYEGNEETANTFTSIEEYMADIILNNNYYGVLKNLNGSTPQNYVYSYALQPNQISLARIYVDLLHQNSTFMSSADAWKALTFSPSDTYQNELDEIGYYEAVLLNVLDCSVKYTILPTAVKDTQKTITTITTPVLKSLKQFADKDYEKLLNQPWAQFSELEQLSMIEAAGAKCTSLQKISGYNSGISTIFSTASDIRSAIEKIASLEKIAEVDEYVVNVLSTMYAKCPSSNMAMRTAILEIKKNCESSFDKTMVEFLTGATSVGNVVVSEGINALWTDAIASLGGGTGAWLLIGQMVGKGLSNFMFSTDACLEQFYMMEALVNLEDVLVSSVKQTAQSYCVCETSERAKEFLTAEKMLLSLYDMSADYAKDFTEIVKTKGVINGIQSIFGFGNLQEFEEYCQVADSIKSGLNIFRLGLFDFDYSYKNALKLDNLSAYTAYLSAYTNTGEYWNATVMTVACPTDVDIFNDSGVKVACVRNNQLFGLVPGIAIWIDGNVKHLVLPKNCAYQVKITGTDDGTMAYTVSEFAEGAYAREIAHVDVPLTTGCTYTSNLPIKENIETDTYILTDDNGNALSPTIDSKELKIAGASLTLQNDLTINYKVKKAIFATNRYQNPYILFELNGMQTKVSEYTEEGEYYVFRFKNIAPNQMKDVIQATLCSSYNGTIVSGETVSYSVFEYCSNMLKRYTTDEYAKLRTLLVDLLQYGAQSQMYTDFQTDLLATDGLTEQELAYGTITYPELKSILDTAYTTIENPTAFWKGAGLKLDNAITVRFILETQDIENMFVHIKTAYGEWNIPASEFIKTDKGYYVYFNGLHAGQLREPIYVTAYQGGAIVSDTVRYSVESYAYAKQESTIPYLSSLVVAMMRYGDSAYAYMH